MTHSFRRRPFAAYCGGSQKQDKRICNRAARRINRVRLRTKGDEHLFTRNREVMDTWSMSQDGTRHYAPYDPRVFETYRRWYRWAKAK